ncbi:MAG: YqcC family protein [Porticoccaceae bacterium]|jgi:uncharacterized protein YqcC (DUF446 family)|nr:YqcC family protein [Porticoccaceae bacterium]
MIDHYRKLADLLIDVERELRLMQLWERQSPSRQALASVEPFAVDQLSFSQWLQFIFLPRMYDVIESAAPLPENSSIAPMAEEFFKAQNTEAAAIILKLAAIDRLISAS